ncbi:MAG: hypothetical protein ABJP86_01040 [Flavobacteriaceae bacterium]
MLRPITPLVEYVVYEDYVAEFLCVNKDRQELECKGKCYLMERLSEQNEQKKQSLPKIAMEEYPIGFVDFLYISAKNELVSKCIDLSFYSNHYSFIFSSSDFHPPNKTC